MKNETLAYLNNNNGFDLLAFGEKERFMLDPSKSLDELQHFIDANENNFIFGFLNYDLKGHIHQLPSNNPDKLEFPIAFFWKPKFVVKLNDGQVEFLQGLKTNESVRLIEEFLGAKCAKKKVLENVNFKARISKEEYVKQVESLKQHIQQGNIYEINFCQEFYAEQIEITNPIETYFTLNQITKAPYSSFIQFDDFLVFSGSPECFLKKKGKQLVSKPIKGTAPRGYNEKEDELIKKQLISDQKERAENIMIVDLVRNDLSRIASPNSVKVDELCHIYTFETVHQMISTISCEIKQHISFSDVLKATFPMGSMTGAPKKKSHGTD